MLNNYCGNLYSFRNSTLESLVFRFFLELNVFIAADTKIYITQTYMLVSFIKAVHSKVYSLVFY